MNWPLLVAVGTEGTFAMRVDHDFAVALWAAKRLHWFGYWKDIFARLIKTRIGSLSR
jgi:hypothetical protein